MWPIFPSVKYFSKCDLFFAVWPVFLSVTHFFKCDPFFQVWLIFSNLTHFSQCHLFFPNLTHFLQCPPFTRDQSFTVWPVLRSVTFGKNGLHWENGALCEKRVTFGTNGSHLQKKWVNLWKIGHTWKNGSLCEEWVKLEKMGHTLTSEQWSYVDKAAFSFAILCIIMVNCHILKCVPHFTVWLIFSKCNPSFTGWPIFCSVTIFKVMDTRSVEKCFLRGLLPSSCHFHILPNLTHLTFYQNVTHSSKCDIW